MGVPQNGWFPKDNPIKMDDDWGYPQFRKPPYIYTYIYMFIYIHTSIHCNIYTFHIYIYMGPMGLHGLLEYRPLLKWDAHVSPIIS